MECETHRNLVNNSMDDYSSPPPSNHQLNKNEADYLALLLTIIESKNWLNLRFSMHSSPATFQWVARKVARVRHLNGLTVHRVVYIMSRSLHACARFNPPLHIVQNILELLPESPSLVDRMNRTPLHIAAGTRADLSIIQLLVNASPLTCAVRDVDGKTPLHLACDSTCELFTGDEDCKRDPPTYDVVSTLIMAYPPAVSLEDEEEMNALEHAIMSDAPIRVVKYLQFVTSQQNRMKAQLPVSRGWQYEPHETIFSLSHAVERNSLEGERVSISNTSDNNGRHQYTPPVRQSMSELKLSEKFEEMKGRRT